MSNSIKQRINKMFQRFVKKELKHPLKCNDLDRLRFYVQGLAEMLTGLEQEHGHVPNAIYQLLSEYNRVQNVLINEHFENDNPQHHIKEIAVCKETWRTSLSTIYRKVKSISIP
jgi:hypothetical protein